MADKIEGSRIENAQAKIPGQFSTKHGFTNILVILNLDSDGFIS